jgi:hypothetical protein
VPRGSRSHRAARLEYPQRTRRHTGAGGLRRARVVKCANAGHLGWSSLVLSGIFRLSR